MAPKKNAAKKAAAQVAAAVAPIVQQVVQAAAAEITAEPTKTYVVVHPVHCGDRYEHDEEIDLDDATAEPLLKIGAIKLPKPTVGERILANIARMEEPK